MEELEAKCVQFLNDFKQKASKSDQLPVQMAGYDLLKSELTGELVEWCYQYLNEKMQCPVVLLPHYIRRAIEQIEQLIQVDAKICGYDEHRNIFAPLRLMQRAISVLIDVCLETLENDKMMEFLKEVSRADARYPKYSVRATKNSRKKMEDRHVCINDFNRLFGLDDDEPTSFYAIFDGHGGTHAAAYSVAHLHHLLATNCKYPKKIDEALREAFVDTDRHYSEKATVQALSSGTTALVAVYRQKERKLYVGWLGDSQALLVKQGRLWQIVKRHSPDTKEERRRIEKLGGSVMNFAGTWRVNGQLGVARAIGPHSYKPYISNEPDISCIVLDGAEDFLIMASDGLWDYVSEDEIAITVYKQLQEDAENLGLVTKVLVESAKDSGSMDNITVVVIFLKDPKDIILPDCMNGAKAVVEEPMSLEPEIVDDEINLLDVSRTDSLENRILMQLRNMHQPQLEAAKEHSEAEKGDAEKLCDRSGISEQVVTGDSGCEESEDEWDYIRVKDSKSSKKQASSEDHQREALRVNPFAEENFALEAAAMSSEVMDSSLFSTNHGGVVVEEKNGADLSPNDEHDLKSLVGNNHHGIPDDLLSPSSHEDFEDGLARDASNLNPTAKEFVPNFGTGPLLSPTAASNGVSMFLLDDDVVAQSPRKATPMENITVPSETEFDQEVASRPHEVEDQDDFIINTNGNGDGLDALNPKEAAQSDDKSEEGYLVEPKPVEEADLLGETGAVSSQFLTFDRFDQPEAMEQSFYEEKTSEELNRVQVLPGTEESLLGNGETLDLDATEVRDVAFGFNPFGQPQDIAQTVENNLIEVTQQVASEMTNLLTEAQNTAAEILEQKQEDILEFLEQKQEPEPAVEEPDFVHVQEPDFVQIHEPEVASAPDQDFNQFEQFEKAMNQQNERHLAFEEAPVQAPEPELLTQESSVDLEVVSPAPVEPELVSFDEPQVPEVPPEVVKVEEPVVEERAFETIVETVEQFVVSPEPSPATVTIPETPVADEAPTPIVVPEEPIVVPEPAPAVETVESIEVTPVVEQKTQLIESIPDVIPKAAAPAKVEAKKPETKASPAAKRTSAVASKTTASPKPKASAITAAPKPAASRPTTAKSTVPATKTSPTTATAKRAVPSAAAAPKPAAPKPAARASAPALVTKTATATSRPGTATSRVTTTTRVTSATRVSSTAASEAPKTRPAAAPAAARPAPRTTTTTATSRPTSTTTAARKPLSAAPKTALAAKAPEDKTKPAPAKPATTTTRTTTSTTAASRKPAQTATSALRAAAAANKAKTAAPAGARTATASTKSSTLATKKTVTKTTETAGGKTTTVEKITETKTLQNGTTEKPVENGAPNGIEAHD